MRLLAVFVTVLRVTTLVESRIIGHNMSMLSDEMIDFINSINTTWTAGRNFDPNTPEHHIVGLMGVKQHELDIKEMKEEHSLGVVVLNNRIEHSTFDARLRWPNCTSISRIRDQGSCGSSWALAVADSISDRMCIALGVEVEYSAEDLLSCCAYCGHGCGGGYLRMAWIYYALHGLVSGSTWNSTIGCKPYTIPACEHHTTGKSGSCGDMQPTPVCSKECQQSFNKTYQADRIASQAVAFQYYTLTYNVPIIMEEIKLYGPVQAQMTVYADFLHYKSGVYQRHSDKVVGVQAFRILGWGDENGQPYWLCANSFGTKWGDNGYFKIIRYQNECDIESRINCAFPRVKITWKEPPRKKKSGFFRWLEELLIRPDLLEYFDNISDE